MPYKCCVCTQLIMLGSLHCHDRFSIFLYSVLLTLANKNPCLKYRVDWCRFHKCSTWHLTKEEKNTKPQVDSNPLLSRQKSNIVTIAPQISTEYLNSHHVLIMLSIVVCIKHKKNAAMAEVCTLWLQLSSREMKSSEIIQRNLHAFSCFITKGIYYNLGIAITLEGRVFAKRCIMTI